MAIVLQVTGDADEHQVVLSIHSYLHQTELLMKGLNQLFQIFRFSECTNQKFALRVVVVEFFECVWGGGEVGTVGGRLVLFPFRLSYVSEVHSLRVFQEDKGTFTRLTT